MNVTIQTEGRRAYIAGDTYPIKYQIKTAGGKWDPDRKQWWIGADKAKSLQDILAKVPEPSAAIPGKCRKCGKDCKPPYTLCWDCKPKPTRCKQCGAKPNARGWPRIYRNGVCSDCYRSEREESEMGY